jgi:hypothetical protein
MFSVDSYIGLPVVTTMTHRVDLQSRCAPWIYPFLRPFTPPDWTRDPLLHFPVRHVWSVACDTERTDRLWGLHSLMARYHTLRISKLWPPSSPDPSLPTPITRVASPRPLFIAIIDQTGTARDSCTDLFAHTTDTSTYTRSTRN